MAFRIIKAVAGKALRVGQRLTNIGTTVPPRGRLTEPPQRLIPTALPVARQIGGPQVHQHVRPTALPIPLPVARHEQEGPGERVIAPDPLWISRWQDTATVPPEKGPWVTGYRIWFKGVAYQSTGLMTSNWIDVIFKDGHRHRYEEIPDELVAQLRRLTTSVGRWLHRNILGVSWRPGMGALFPSHPI